LILSFYDERYVSCSYLTNTYKSFNL
jgi:hypothetical protein